MGHSSLLGTERAAAVPAGRDTAALGPGDSSDSGSDMMGIEDSDQGDPGVPVDVALRDDMPHSLLPDEVMDGAASDAGGTGERRSAGSDAGVEAADIGVDHVFTPGKSGTRRDDEAGVAPVDEDAALALIDQAVAGDPVDDEDLEDDAGPAEDETDGPPRNRSARATGRHPRALQAASPPQPAPGQPVDPGVPGALEDDGDEGAAPPLDTPDGDVEGGERRPGRASASSRRR